MIPEEESSLGVTEADEPESDAALSVMGRARKREIEQAKTVLETIRALTGSSFSALANDAGFAASTVSRFMRADSPNFVIKPQTLKAILDKAIEATTEYLVPFPAEIEVVRSLEPTDPTPPGLSIKATALLGLLRLREETVRDPGLSETVRYSSSSPAGGPPTRVVGAVEAGVFREAFEIPIEDQNTLPIGCKHYGADSFALEVIGDSMDRRFPDGSLLICRRFNPESEPLPDQKLVIAMRRDARTDAVEATVKRLTKLASSENYVLMPESSNPIHAPLPLEDLGEFSVYIFAVVLAAVTTV